MASNNLIYDVAIIGGGAMGLACAWKLASRGAKVVLFERARPGQEASHAAAGMLAPLCESAVHGWKGDGAARAAMLKLCLWSRDLYPEFATRLLEETGLDSELSLRGAPTTDWRESGIRFVPALAADSRLNTLLQHGTIAPWHGQDAVFLPDDGQVDNRKLVEALRVAALGKGVVFRENCTVTRLAFEGKRMVGVFKGETLVRAERVLLCAGAWSGQIAGLPPEITDSVRPLAGQMVQLRGERRLRHIIYSDSCYLVPRRDGRVLIGATVEEIGFEKRVTAGGVGQLLSAACALAPELRDATLEAHWAGLRPATPDGLPLLGATSLQNLLVATGHGRNGVLLAPATAHLIADLVLENREVDAAFSASRFVKSRNL